MQKGLNFTILFNTFFIKMPPFSTIHKKVMIFLTGCNKVRVTESICQSPLL
jgi:hypothetical protein